MQHAEKTLPVGADLRIRHGEGIRRGNVGAEGQPIVEGQVGARLHRVRAARRHVGDGENERPVGDVRARQPCLWDRIGPG